MSSAVSGEPTHTRTPSPARTRADNLDKLGGGVGFGHLRQALVQDHAVLHAAAGGGTQEGQEWWRRVGGT